MIGLLPTAPSAGKARAARGESAGVELELRRTVATEAIVAFEHLAIGSRGIASSVTSIDVIDLTSYGT